MSLECLNPRIAIQDEPKKKPRFLKHRDFEYYVKLNEKVLNGNLLLLPCGKCPNCLEKKAQDWTNRLVKEAECWKYTYFITLTYDEKHKKDLNKKDIQDFTERLHYIYGKDNYFDYKYFITGEYGETTHRPHYHGIFFCDAPLDDLKFYANNLWTSKKFDDLWKNGSCMIGQDVNRYSIKYSIGYTLKKLGETKLSMMSKGLGLRYLKENYDKIKRYEGFYTNDGNFASIPFYLMRKIKESKNPVDAEWLFLQSLTPKSSILLSGNTIGNRLRDLLNTKEKIKGKGVF